LRDLQLYVITDSRAAEGRDLVRMVKAAIDGGAEVVQLRDKNLPAKELIKVGLELQDLCRRKDVIFIINDRPDVALAVNSDGVHLGQDDLPIAVARRIMAPEKIIGVSTHTIKQALEAEEQGADYIGVGPVFATPTKSEYKPVGLELVSQVKEKLSIPFVAIGGIDEKNIDEVIAAGAECAAVVRAVMAARDPAEAAKKLKKKLSVLKNGCIKKKNK